MFSILSIIAPVFLVILLGLVLGRSKSLSSSAESGIAEFAFKVAIPALLFKTIAASDLGAVSVGSVWGAFYASISITYFAVLLACWRILPLPPGDSPSVGLSSVFGNTVMLGLPISIATYGESAVAPLAVILSTHAPILWAIAVVHSRLETSASAGESFTDRIFRDLAGNPIIIAIFLGLGWRFLGLPLPTVAVDVLQLLAQAGIPGALVALGLSLAHFQISGSGLKMFVALGGKLVLLPTLALVFGKFVFELDGADLGTVMIMSAVPTGANAYIFAIQTGRGVDAASGAVALGTALSTLTIPVALLIVGG